MAFLAIVIRRKLFCKHDFTVLYSLLSNTSSCSYHYHNYIYCTTNTLSTCKQSHSSRLEITLILSVRVFVITKQPPIIKEETNYSTILAVQVLPYPIETRNCEIVSQTKHANERIVLFAIWNSLLLQFLCYKSLSLFNQRDRQLLSTAIGIIIHRCSAPPLAATIIQSTIH